MLGLQVSLYEQLMKNKIKLFNALVPSDSVDDLPDDKSVPKLTGLSKDSFLTAIEVAEFKGNDFGDDLDIKMDNNAIANGDCHDLERNRVEEVFQISGNDAVYSNVSSQTIELEETKRKLLETELRFKEAQSQLENSQKELTDSHNELKVIKIKLDSTENELKQTNDQLKDTQMELNNLKSKLDSTQNELKDTKNNQLKLKNNLNDNQNRLEDAGNELEATKRALEESQNSLKIARGELNETKLKLKESNMELHAITGKYQQSQSKIREIVEERNISQAKLKQLQSKLQDTLGELNVTQAKLKKSNSDLKESNEKINVAHQQQQDSMNELKDTKLKFNDAINKLKNLKTTLNEQQSRLLNYESELKNTKQTLQESQTNFKNAKEEIEALKQAFKSEEIKNRKLSQNVINLSSQVKDLACGKNELEKQLNAKQQNIAQLLVEKNELNSNVTDIHSKATKISQIAIQDFNENLNLTQKLEENLIQIDCKFKMIAKNITKISREQTIAKNNENNNKNTISNLRMLENEHKIKINELQQQLNLKNEYFQDFRHQLCKSIEIFQELVREGRRNKQNFNIQWMQLLGEIDNAEKLFQQKLQQEMELKNRLKEQNTLLESQKMELQTKQAGLMEELKMTKTNLEMKVADLQDKLNESYTANKESVDSLLNENRKLHEIIKIKEQQPKISKTSVDPLPKIYSFLLELQSSLLSSPQYALEDNDFSTKGSEYFTKLLTEIKSKTVEMKQNYEQLLDELKVKQELVEKYQSIIGLDDKNADRQVCASVCLRSAAAAVGESAILKAKLMKHERLVNKLKLIFKDNEESSTVMHPILDKSITSSKQNWTKIRKVTQTIGIIQSMKRTESKSTGQKLSQLISQQSNIETDTLWRKLKVFSKVVGSISAPIAARPQKESSPCSNLLETTEKLYVEMHKFEVDHGTIKKLVDSLLEMARANLNEYTILKLQRDRLQEKEVELKQVRLQLMDANKLVTLLQYLENVLGVFPEHQLADRLELVIQVLNEHMEYNESLKKNVWELEQAVEARDEFIRNQILRISNFTTE